MSLKYLFYLLKGLAQRLWIKAHNFFVKKFQVKYLKKQKLCELRLYKVA